MHLRRILRQAGLVGFCCGALMISIPSLVSKSSAEAPRRTMSSGDPMIPQQRMGAPLLGLTAEQLERFFVGREQFERVFTADEGLGPVFNNDSCGGCHSNPLGGPGSVTVTRAGRLDKGGFDPLTELGGSLFQESAIDDACAEVVPEEANVIAFRVTNGMMGYGLVEAIPDAAILANADPDDLNGDGISGKAVIVGAVEDDLDHVGRFGWKAHAPSMITFSAGASKNEMGITNPFKPTDNDPNGINPPELADCDTVADPEIGVEFIEQLADFQRFLTAAPQTPKSGMTGEVLFVSIDCADCHIPAFMTPDDPGLEDALRNKEIRQYTDYLVHDVGLAADFIEAGEAGPRELKTAPLAGIRTRDPMWHDGRVAAGSFADRMRAAIACHCALLSEAGASAERFLSGTMAECPDSLTVPGSGFQCAPGEVEGGLTDQQRDAVIAFLDSLGRREFDADGENGVLVDDFTNMFLCSMIDVPITPDHECAVHDIDQNGIIDGSDFESFLLAFDGELFDCNCNGTNDLADIFFGQSSDGDGDGVPDECPPGDPPVCGQVRTLVIKQGACPAPVNPNGNGVVPMVLVGDVDFAADTAVPGSLELRVCGDAGGPSIAPLAGHIKVKDLNHPFEGDVECGGCACNGDQSSDGIADLELKFRTSDLLALGLGAESGVTTVELSGELADGSSFTARDCLVIVPPSAGQNNLYFEANVIDTLIEVTPLDLEVDADGFTAFARSYVNGTQVTVTAPLLSEGRRFLRWSVDGVLRPVGLRSVEVTVGQSESLKLFYQRRARALPDRPTESQGDME
ncbi:MAG: hypothetical protein IID34_09020 [Planctomycetes bacterium]|nr:hypothetical protein [Planctomycetota bacterium]